MGDAGWEKGVSCEGVGDLRLEMGLVGRVGRAQSVRPEGCDAPGSPEPAALRDGEGLVGRGMRDGVIFRLGGCRGQ